jgi:glycosyltransferase involved in cell wall biosynthesis
VKYEPNTLEEQLSAGEGLPVAPGCLDGITIMRYAHIERERASGGVEQYLRHLHQGLLQRHRITVLQMHLTRDAANNAIDIEHVGIGRILWVPVVIVQTESRLTHLPKRARYIYDRLFLLRQQEGKREDGATVSSTLDFFRRQGRHLRHKTAVLSDHMAGLLARRQVNLLIMHWMNYDADPLIARTLEAGIPFAFINHFDNARFVLPQTRKWLTRATAIGTVSDRGIPDDLRDRCTNLSDAVDTEFFAPEKATPISVPVRPIVLLPARIDTGKGHHDLMEAARILIARNVDFTLCFVGAVECEALHQDLRRSVVARGLEGRVDFLGEKSAEEIRNLYACSSVVVLPSRSEGFGRVLLEAQAMKKPVVAYDCGGIREAMLPHETGYLIEKGNVDALAGKIGFLLENVSERLRFGQHGREFVSRQFGVSKLVQRHETFYLRALHRGGAKGNGAFSRLGAV